MTEIERDETEFQDVNEPWIAGLTYKGNSVTWWHSKAENYKAALERAWNALIANGVNPDGLMDVAGGIHKLGQHHTLPGREADLEVALMAVVNATRLYLPPDGIEAKDCISMILEAVDNPTINPIILDIERRDGDG